MLSDQISRNVDKTANTETSSRGPQTRSQTREAKQQSQQTPISIQQPVNVGETVSGLPNQMLSTPQSFSQAYAQARGPLPNQSVEYAYPERNRNNYTQGFGMTAN